MAICSPIGDLVRDVILPRDTIGESLWRHVTHHVTGPYWVADLVSFVKELAVCRYITALDNEWGSRERVTVARQMNWRSTYLRDLPPNQSPIQLTELCYPIITPLFSASNTYSRREGYAIEYCLLPISSVYSKQPNVSREHEEYKSSADLYKVEVQTFCWMRSRATKWPR